MAARSNLLIFSFSTGLSSNLRMLLQLKISCMFIASNFSDMKSDHQNQSWLSNLPRLSKTYFTIRVVPSLRGGALDSFAI
jgi:hypothetical protein